MRFQIGQPAVRQRDQKPPSSGRHSGHAQGMCEAGKVCPRGDGVGHIFPPLQGADSTLQSRSLATGRDGIPVAGSRLLRLRSQSRIRPWGERQPATWRPRGLWTKKKRVVVRTGRRRTRCRAPRVSPRRRAQFRSYQFSRCASVEKSWLAIWVGRVGAETGRYRTCRVQIPCRSVPHGVFAPCRRQPELSERSVIGIQTAARQSPPPQWRCYHRACETVEHETFLCLQGVTDNEKFPLNDCPSRPRRLQSPRRGWSELAATRVVMARV